MSLKSLFMFNRKQQRGIFVLVLIIALLLLVRHYFVSSQSSDLVLIDASLHQRHIDSLKTLKEEQRHRIYPFNPNYITPYRAYVLGINDEQLGRLERFRKSGKFINSTAQFQQVTGVSNAWLDSISPYFKFPKWVTQTRSKPQYTSQKITTIQKKDLNQASLDELKAVYGIGPALSNRIVKQKEKIGRFIDPIQLKDVYGLQDSTITELQKHFYIQPPAGFVKIALNTASREELLRIPYCNDYLVDQLIKQRKLRDGFKSWDKVVLTSRFPEEKLHLIQLYLTLD